MITAILSQIQIATSVCCKHTLRLEMIRAASHKAPKQFAIESSSVTTPDAPEAEADQTVRLNAEAKLASLQKSFRAIWETSNA